MLRSVAVLFHPRRKEAIEGAEWLGLEMQRRGVRASVGNAWDGSAVEHVCDGKDLVVVLGGDGTIIHVARLAAPHGVPLVGVNLGRVGFLAELAPTDLQGAVDDLAEARFRVEERTMLDVRLASGGDVWEDTCLNEVALARGLAPRAIRVRTLLDGEEFTTYTADGVLVVTATGSTAYSLAAGGPIVYPESRDLLITPVAPHLHIGRSLIVPGDTTVTLTLTSELAAAVISDGETEHSLEPGERLEVRRSHVSARFARLDRRKYFYRAIADRLR